MQIEELALAGLRLIRPSVHRDERGRFVETFRDERYARVGITCSFVQDNHAESTEGVLRGLHYQTAPGQDKLVWVTLGRIYDVAVDIRPSSATFGKWVGVELDAESMTQLFVPVGFAHGYCIVSPRAVVQYKVSSPYDPKTEASIRYDDPEIGVMWPVAQPILSKRDQEAPAFASFRRSAGV